MYRLAWVQADVKRKMTDKLWYRFKGALMENRRHSCQNSLLQAMKPPTQQAQGSAEGVDGRARIKENVRQSHTPPAREGRGAPQGLAGVRHALI
jgi:hypothetical protein